MTPLLIIFAGIQPTVAIGTDLAYGAVTKTVGGWRHWRNRTVDFGVCWWLAAGSLPGALVGVWLLDRLHTALGSDFDQWLLACVAGALMVAALTILGRVLLMPNSAEGERDQVVMTRGAQGGGGGHRPLPRADPRPHIGGQRRADRTGAHPRLPPPPPPVVGTDVFHAAVLLWVAGLAHWVSGNVDFALMGNILIGSIPGRADRLAAGHARAGRRPASGAGLRAAGLGARRP